MQAHSILYSFQLCLLIGICTSFPSPESESESDSDSDDDGKVVKLKGVNKPVDSEKKDNLSDGYEPVNAEEKDNLSDGNVPANADVSDTNEPVNAEEKHDLSVANEPVNAKEKDNLSDGNDPANADVSDTNQPVNAEEKHEVPGADPVNAEEIDDIPGASQPVDKQDNNNLSGDQPVDSEDNDNPPGINYPGDVEKKMESGANQPFNSEESNVAEANLPDDGDKAKQPDSSSPGKDGVPDSNEEDAEEKDLPTDHYKDDDTSPPPVSDNEAVDIISEGCKKGNDANCELVVENLPFMPGFKLNENEIKKFKLWPDAQIPYYIDEFSYDKVLRDKIRLRLEEARILGLTFLELPEPPEGDDKRWVFFVNRRGQLDCKDYSTNSFTNTGVQKVIIGYDCLKHGGPMAAIVMALAGVPPQHNAPNRDKFITINEDHILPKKKGLFKKLSDGEWLFHDLGYDYRSVTHYHAHKYSADGSPTIVWTPAQRRSGEDVNPDLILKRAILYIEWKLNNDAKTYSNLDIIKVRMLYNNLRVSDANPRLKEEDCNAMYQPGPNFKEVSLQSKRHVAEYPKPKQYLAAAGQSVDPDKSDESGAKTVEKKLGGYRDIEGEPLSALEHF